MSRADGLMYAGRVVLGCWSRGPQQALCVGGRLCSSQRTHQACSLWAAPFIINAEVVWLGRLQRTRLPPLTGEFLTQSVEVAGKAVACSRQAFVGGSGGCRSAAPSMLDIVLYFCRFACSLGWKMCGVEFWISTGCHVAPCACPACPACPKDRTLKCYCRKKYANLLTYYLRLRIGRFRKW